MSTMNKAARAALARETINKLVPSILSSNPRAQKGVQSAQLLRGRTDLPKIESAPAPFPHKNNHDHAQQQLDSIVDTTPSSPELHPRLPIHLVQSDTLDAAQKLLAESHPGARIAVLNMASPLQPGGGVLRGAKAQEESLCLRSTLYPSLRNEWYRHPDDAVVYTPDVLVFRTSAAPAAAAPEMGMQMLPVSDRFYVDVISCAAPRHPETLEVDVESHKTKTEAATGSGKKEKEKERRYADPRDEELMTLKIKFIMRAAVKMGVTHLVLGASGCGAYRNPIAQVARIMRRCLVGKGNGRPAEEDWRGAGLEQVVIAILDESKGKLVWRTFVEEFRDEAHVEGG